MPPVAQTKVDDTPVVGTGMPGAARYFPELEALRGLAFVLVFLRHSDGIVTFASTDTGTHVSLLGAFVRAGHTAASLFFILSAFLLSLPFLVEAQGGRPVRRSTGGNRARMQGPSRWSTPGSIRPGRRTSAAGSSAR